MLKSVLLTVFVFINVDLGLCKYKFPNVYGTLHTKKITSDLDGPLILTPYLERGEFAEAQALSKVSFSEFEDVESFSGYFTVDKTFNSNLFFWFFPAFEDSTDAPVVLWLQGGPGASSLFGLFDENGPFNLLEGGKVELRDVTWARTCNLIYIDSPAATGFSFTTGGIPDDQTKVGEDLYNAMQQFFQLFPNLRKNDFFITGESYAGKYVPALAYTVLKKDDQGDQKINLKGIAMGNGLSDPLHQFQYGNRLYELGFIDEGVQEIYRHYEIQAVDYIEGGNYQMAFHIFGILIDGDEDSLFYNVTRIDNVYNFITPSDDSSNQFLEQFINREDVREAIHVGNQDFSDGQDVWNALKYDIPKSVAPWIEELLENYRVLIYNGQLDLLVPYPPTVDFIRSLNFSSAAEYKSAKRNPWFVGNEVAGYAKEAGNLLEVLVRNAGHMVPADQPDWSYALIYSFTRNKSFK